MKIHWIFGLLLMSFNAAALEIYPLVSGEIIMIKPAGTLIKQGELLLKIDATQAKLELDYLQARQKIYQQDFDDKQLELKQTQELYERLVASHRDLDLMQLSFNAAERELEAHNIKVKIATVELQKYQIYAPLSGVIKATPHLRNATNLNAPKILMILE
jgi:multidrug resistance efflux pump